MAGEQATMELGMRWRKARRQAKAACRKAGMEWADFLILADRIGMPGRDNQATWVEQAKKLAKAVGYPRAIDWQALIDALMPIVEQLIALCVK